MLGGHRTDQDNVRGPGAKATRGRAADVSKARLLYVMGQQWHEPGPPPNKGSRWSGRLAALAAIGTIITSAILLDQYFSSGEAGRDTGPFLTAVTNVITAVGMGVGHVAHGAAVVGPVGGAIGLLLFAVVLRLAVERLGLFLTFSIRFAFHEARDRHGPAILLMEYTIACLLFLPLAGAWVATFYSSVSPGELMAFGVAYLVTLALASLLAVRTVPPEHPPVMLGQFISVLSGLATTIALYAQGFSSLLAPIHNPWFAAITALIATIAARFLIELLGFRSTPRVNLSEVVFGWLFLSPIAALWLVAFAGAVPIWGVALFIAVYLVVVALASAQSVWVLIMRRRPRGQRV